MKTNAQTPRFYRSLHDCIFKNDLFTKMAIHNTYFKNIFFLF